MRSLLLLALVASSGYASAAESCILGSLKMLGDELYTCGPDPFGGDPTYKSRGVSNKSFVSFLEANKGDKALNARLKNSVGVSAEEAITYFKDSNDPFIAVTADQNPEDLRIVVDAFNDHYGYTLQMAQLSAAEKAAKDDDNRRDNLNKGFEELDAIAERNDRNMKSLVKTCGRAGKAEAKLDAIEVRFADDGSRQYALPVSTVGIDGSKTKKRVYFVDDEGGIKSRIIEINGDQMSYTGKDGNSYEVTIQKVSASRLGRIRNIGDTKSTSCYLAELYAKGASKTDGGSGGDAEAVKE